MNAARRERINRVLDKIKDLKIEIESVKDYEQDAFHNLPDSLQRGEKGKAIESAVSNLEEAISNFDEVEAQLNSAIE